MRGAAEWSGNSVKQHESTHELRSLLAFLLLFTVSILNGCAGLVSGNTTPPPLPSFQLAPLSLNFGSVALGKQSTKTSTVTNTGTASVTISKVTFSNSQFSLSGVSLPMALASGQSTAITIAVAPSATGNVSGTMTVEGDGGSTPVVVNLSATGATPQPQISVSSPSLDFGTVTVGSQGSSSLTISNNGAADLTISVLTLTGADFGVSGISTPKTIPAGQSAGLSLTYKPNTTGASSGNLAITSNDPANQTLNIPLSGTGSATPTGQLSANPMSLSFGNVNTGSSSAKQIIVTNTGSAAVHISAITPSGSGFTVSGVTVPATVNPSQTATLTVTFAPTSAGSATGGIAVTSDASNPTLSLTLSGTGVATSGTLTANPTSLSFGSVTSGSNSSKQVVITNTGSADVHISDVSTSGSGFSVSGLSVPATLSASQSATLSVKFAPTTTGSLAGSLTITSDATGSPLTVSLSGTGTAAPTGQLTPNPTSLSFGNVTTGSNSAKQIVITNSGSAAVHVSAVNASGSGFTVSGLTVPATLNASQTATLTVTFAPTSAGSATGSITLTSDASNSPLSVSVSGTGVAAVGQLSANPTSLSFGNVAAGSNSAKQIVLTNTGSGAVHISAVSASGTGFSVSGISVPATLNPSQTATLTITFAPTAGGSVTGSVTVTSDATGSPLSISLSGTGTQPGLSVSPSTFNFGSIVDGQTASQNFSITNTGSASLTVAQISSSGASYSVSGLSTPATIAAGQSATFTVTFAPTTAGSLPGSVTITSNAPSSPTTVSLSGTGVAATVTVSATPSSLAFGSISAGGTSSKTVSISNAGNSNITISQISVSAGDVQASGITVPKALTPGQSATLTVTFSPQSAETISGNVTVTTSQGSNAVIPVSGTGTQPAVTLTPSSVSFGSITVGSSNSQTIQIKNSGTGTLTVSQISVTGSGFSTSGVSLPISLTAGQTSNFNVQFAPSSAGSATGSISVVSNDPGSPDTISLSGTGVAATKTISLSPSSLSFGNVTTGTSSSKSVTVTNTGNANVQISSITASGTDFSLSGVTTPVTLTPGQTTSFSVLFSPSSASTDSGSVSVTSDATGSPASLSLSGTGVAPVSHTVQLNWTASTSSVSGYNIYRSTTNGSGYVKVNGSLVAGVSYTDSTVQNATTYYYVTTAVDSTGEESIYSNQATAVIP